MKRGIFYYLFHLSKHFHFHFHFIIILNMQKLCQLTPGVVEYGCIEVME